MNSYQTAGAVQQQPMAIQGAVTLTPATMNIAQAAIYLGIAKSTLYTWRTRRPGFGPRAVKAGGALRYRRSDLDEWIEAQAEPPDADAGSDAENGRLSLQGPDSRTQELGSMSRRSRPRRP